MLILTLVVKQYISYFAQWNFTWDERNWLQLISLMIKGQRDHFIDCVNCNFVALHMIKRYKFFWNTRILKITHVRNEWKFMFGISLENRKWARNWISREILCHPKRRVFAVSGIAIFFTIVIFPLSLAVRIFTLTMRQKDKLSIIIFLRYRWGKYCVCVFVRDGKKGWKNMRRMKICARRTRRTISVFPGDENKQTNRRWKKQKMWKK